MRHAHGLSDRPVAAGTMPSAQRSAIEDVARWVVDRRLTVPAILFLESMRPLNRVGSVAMTFFHPLIGAIFTWPQYAALRDAMESRGSVEYVIERIEELDAAVDSHPPTDSEGSS